MDIKKILKNILDIIIKIIENTGDFIIFIFKLPFNLYLPYDNYLEDREEFKGLPYGCWHCQLLGICRRPKEENWKCYNGCILLNEKYKGLPKGCWNCEYLNKCRRPKEENWKCYNGCIKIHLKDYENKEK